MGCTFAGSTFLSLGKFTENAGSLGKLWFIAFFASEAQNVLQVPGSKYGTQCTHSAHSAVRILET